MLLRRSRHRRSTHRGIKTMAALALVLPLATISPAGAANVGTNVEPSTVNYGSDTGNTYFVYLEAGDYVYSSGNSSTARIFAPGSGQIFSGPATGAPFRTPRLVTAETAGVWTFAFEGATVWNVTAFDGNPGAAPETAPTATEITGRVWTQNYKISQLGSGTSLKNLRFWMLNDNGYQYAMRITGYDGIFSTISADSIGVPQGATGGLECAPSYRSTDSGAHPFPSGVTPCASPYRLFFEEPAADLPVSAPIAPTQFNGERTTQVIQPAPVDPDDLDVSDFAYSPDGPGTAAGRISYDLGGFIGGHELQLDIDGDGDYTSDVDRKIRLGAAGEPVQYEFDGLDGKGNPIDPCRDLTARVYLDRVGEVHVLQGDVEGRAGMQIVRQNGPGAPDDTIYWDDTATGNRGNTTPLVDGTAGVASTGGVHGWAFLTNTGNSWGNSKYIDDWTYVPVDKATSERTFRSGCESDLAIEKSSELITDNGIPDVGDVGDVLRYSFKVSNPSNVDVDDVSIDDDRVSGVTPAQQDVPAGASRTFTADYTITQDDVDSGSIVNVATATGTEPDGDKVTSPPDSDIHLPADRNPGLSIDKESTLSGADNVADIGEQIDYTFDVTNTGNVTMTGVTVDDDRVSEVSPGPVTLTPGQSQRFTASYIVTADDILTGVIHNEATATGTSPTGPYESPFDEEETGTADADPRLELVKSSSFVTDNGAAGIGDVGDVVQYDFQVTNSGNVALTGVSVDDPMLTGVTPGAVDLGVGESQEFTATYTITQADIDRGTLRNVATATGTFDDPEDPGTPPGVTSPPGDTTVELVPQDPELEITKSASLADTNGNTKADRGEDITYSFTVHNTGNTTLENVTVFDEMVTGITPDPVTLAPGEQQVFTAAPYRVTQKDVDNGGVTNVAVSRGTIPGGRDTTSDPDEHTEKGPDRDPALDLVKHSQLLDENGNGTADKGEQIVYSFTVTNTGNVTVRSIGMSDAMLDGLLPDPIPVLLPRDSYTVTAQPYTVTEDDVTGDDIVNVATAAGEDPQGGEVASEDASTSTPTTLPAGDGPEQSGPGGLLPDTGSPLWWGSLLAALGAIAIGAAMTRVRQKGEFV